MAFKVGDIVVKRSSKAKSLKLKVLKIISPSSLNSYGTWGNYGKWGNRWKVVNPKGKISDIREYQITKVEDELSIAEKRVKDAEKLWSGRNHYLITLKQELGQVDSYFPKV